MIEREVTMTELRQNLAGLVNQAAYGHERIVLVSHGQPKAAIVGIEELAALQRTAANADGVLQAEEDSFLTTSAALRERIRHWQEAHGVTTVDSTVLLREMREEWDDEADSVR
jgi:prevent-host-death family protein